MENQELIFIKGEDIKNIRQVDNKSFLVNFKDGRVWLCEVKGIY